MIKAIIFDCFGVLVGDGFDFTYRYAGGDPEKDKVFIESLLNKANLAEITPEEFRVAISDKLGITVDEWNSATKKSEILNKDLMAYIKTLRRDYKTAIMSNVNRGGLERRITPQQLEEHFDAVVASGDVGYMKPEREIYELTADKLGVKLSECVFIDDRQGYVAPAIEYGMKGIVYRSFTQMKNDLESILNNQ